MKLFRVILTALLVLLSWNNQGKLYAQGFGVPLTFQGLDQGSNHSTASRARGGTLFGSQSDVATMFLNPAAMQNLKGLQFSVSGIQRNFDAGQVQQYSPLKYYSNFSLFMEGLSRNIPNPQYDTINHKPATAADSVQRPFDNINTNWNQTRSNTPSVQAFAAVPFSIAEMKFTVGVGMNEYSNLDWYFQNNNVLSPSVLTPDAYNRSRPINDADSSSRPVQWYQYTQQRKGTIHGYGGALSLSVTDNMFIGVSATVLKGSSDDHETRRERGRIRFYQNYFRAESVYYRVSQTGTSEYSGQELSLSGFYRSKTVGFGFSIQSPTIITRSFTNTITTDTTGSTTSKIVTGKDQMTIPLRGRLGLSIAMRENISLLLDYELRPYSSAEYKDITGKKSTPWLSSNVVHLGVEYVPSSWLVLRCGVREHAEVFEPEANALTDEPVGFTVFSAGAGVRFENFALDLAYEYAKMKYVDTWSSAVSINTETKHAVSAALSYEIPW